MSSQILDNFCQSSFWDANLTWYTDNPDFTPCFQNTVLVWVPCGVLWLLFPLEVALVSRTNQKPLPYSILNITKIVVLILLAILSAMKLANQVYHDDFQTVDNVAVAIKFGTFVLALLVAICFGRRGGVVSSGVQFLFWSLTAISEVIIFRSSIMDNYLESGRKDDFGLIIKSVNIPLVLSMLILSAMSEGASDENQLNNKSPEEAASFYSRMVHSWLTRAVWNGWKTTLTPSDVYELNHSDKALTVSSKFENYLNYKPSTIDCEEVEMESLLKGSRSNANKQGFISIEMACFKTVWKLILAGAILQFLADVVLYATPFMIGLLISFASSDEPLWKGVFYACLMGLTGMANCLLLEGVGIIYTRFGLRLKSATMHALYKKVLRLSNIDRSDMTMGEILNTIYIDTSRFVVLATQLPFLWSIPVHLLLCFYFLYNEIGASSFTGLVVLLLTIPFSVLITRKSKNIQTLQMKVTDKRVKMMSEILNGIRVLKLYAWESSFQEIVSNLRKEEISFLKKRAHIYGLSFCLGATAPYVAGLCCFATFVLIDDANVLTTRKAFVSFQLLRIVTSTVYSLPQLIQTLALTKVSISRISKVLNFTETDEYTDKSKTSNDGKYGKYILISFE